MRQEIGNEQEYLEDLKERSEKRVKREFEMEEQLQAEKDGEKPRIVYSPKQRLNYFKKQGL